MRKCIREKQHGGRGITNFVIKIKNIELHEKFYYIENNLFRTSLLSLRINQFKLISINYGTPFAHQEKK